MTKFTSVKFSPQQACGEIGKLFPRRKLPAIRYLADIITLHTVFTNRRERSLGPLLYMYIHVHVHIYMYTCVYVSIFVSRSHYIFPHFLVKNTKLNVILNVILFRSSVLLLEVVTSAKFENAILRSQVFYTAFRHCNAL